MSNIEASANYTVTAADVWQGRIDDPADRDSYRWHQVVEMIDLTKDRIAPGHSGFCFLGFCSEEGVRRNLGRAGTSRGPESIRRELANLPCHFGSDTRLFDAGDVLCADGNLEKSLSTLSDAVHAIISQGAFPIILGGGHEMSLGNYNGMMAGLAETHGKPKIGIVNFDAHFDLRPYSGGSNSGSAFLQIADQCKERGTGFSYFCAGIQQSANTKSLFRKADELGAEYVMARYVDEDHLPHLRARLDRFVAAHHHLYLTICGDVFSSAFAPGVSAPQPFGLHPEILLRLIKHVVRSGKVACVDIAEVSPRFDNDNRTSKLAAIIVFAVVNTIVGAGGSDEETDGRGTQS